MNIILITEANISKILKRVPFGGDGLIRFMTEWVENRHDTDLYLTEHTFRVWRKNGEEFDLECEWQTLTRRFAEACFEFDNVEARINFVPMSTKEISYA